MEAAGEGRGIVGCRAGPPRGSSSADFTTQQQTSPILCASAASRAACPLEHSLGPSCRPHLSLLVNSKSEPTPLPPTTTTTTASLDCTCHVRRRRRRAMRIRCARAAAVVHAHNTWSAH